MPPTPSQFDKSAMNPDGSIPQLSYGTSSKRQDVYHCPHCPKEYTTSTWLGNHIKVKHSAGIEENSRRVSVESIVRRYQTIQESCYSALVKDLQNMSSRLKEVLPLIDDVVPLLQELGEASSRSRAIDRPRLRNLKRRASSLDLREGESMKRKGVPAYSPGDFMPHDSEWVRDDEPETRNNRLITYFVDGQRFASNEFDYSPSVAQHSASRHVQRSRLPPSQGMESYRTTPGSEFHHPQFHTALSQVQKSQMPNRREQFWNTQDPTQPGADAQPLHSSDMLYQEPPKGQSTTQTLRHSSGSSPMDFQHGLGNELDNSFRQCGFSSPRIANATGESTLPAQLLGDLEERDDPLFNT